MYAAAEDQAEAARIRAALYAPPEGRTGGRSGGRSGGRAGAGAGAGMGMGQAQAMMARIAAEDARYNR